MLRTIRRGTARSGQGRGFCLNCLLVLAALCALPLVALLLGSIACREPTAAPAGSWCAWWKGATHAPMHVDPSPAPAAGKSPSPASSPAPAPSPSPAKDLLQKAERKNTHGVDNIIMPKSDEDIERIMKWPHVDECNLCQVCIPHHVVAKHPRAQEKAKLLSHILDRGDLIEEAMKKKPEDANPKSGAAASEDKARRTLGESEPFPGEGASGGAGAGAGGARKLRELDTIESDGIYHFKGRPIDIREVAPGDTRAPLRKHLPNCTMCWGCKHTLEPMASGDVLFDSYYAHEPGGSPSWLFQVRTNKTKSGWAVVKTWCVPVMKVKQRGLAMCSPPKVYTQVKLLLAQQQITAECGLNELVPKLWIEPLHGVLPGHGFRIDWLGLWFDAAEGVSVQNIQEFGKPRVKPEVMLDLFQTKVNHTAIKLAAIFDLLFSQCDRHQQNIFMTEEGTVSIIDNDQVYATAWRKCGIDSMIVPTTQKFMINHLGFFYVLKYPQKDPPTTWVTDLNPLLLLDYRCHVENGTIGSSFPPSLQQCMKDLASKTVEAIFWEYGYPAERMADAVRNRSRDMLEHGFEWTLLHGEPANQAPHRYKMAPSCCKMSFEKNKYKCLDPDYFQMPEIPFGNPWHGGDWHGTPGKDPGRYVGGSLFEDLVALRARLANVKPGGPLPP